MSNIMSEIIDSYFVDKEFATLIANADSSGLSEEEILEFDEWEHDNFGKNDYAVLSDNDETVWHICDVTGYHAECIRVNKMRIRNE